MVLIWSSFYTKVLIFPFFSFPHYLPFFLIFPLIIVPHVSPGNWDHTYYINSPSIMNVGTVVAKCCKYALLRSFDVKREITTFTIITDNVIFKKRLRYRFICTMQKWFVNKFSLYLTVSSQQLLFLNLSRQSTYLTATQILVNNRQGYTLRTVKKFHPYIFIFSIPLEILHAPWL